MDNKGGRPSAKSISRHAKGGRKKVGRPVGDKAIMDGYKARMLNSPKSKHVLSKLFDIALDDDHKHQVVAIKMVVDRIAPTTIFDKQEGGNPNIAITINTLLPPTEVVSEQ